MQQRLGERRLRSHGLPPREEQTVLETAARILDAGLAAGGSIFTPGATIWNLENATELKRAFNDNLDEGPGTFASKLVSQLRRCPPGAVQLAAELQYLMYLPAKDVRAETKRERVTMLLELLPDPVRLPPELSQVCELGVINFGMGFKMQGWRQLLALYEFVWDWFRQPDSVREQALTDPWRFKTLVERDTGARAIRNSLLYLAFPDTFEPIVSSKQKEDIRAAFGDELTQPTGDPDRDLLVIREVIEQRLGRDFSFLEPELAAQWRGGAGRGHSPAPSPRPAPVDSSRQAWLVRGSNVQGSDLVPAWLRDGVCTLSARGVENLRPEMNRDELVRLVDDAYGFASYNERNIKVGELHAFLKRMDVGDVVATTHDDKLHLGRVTGPAETFRDTDGRAGLWRRVRWTDPDAPVDIADLAPTLRSRLAAQQDVVDLTRDLPLLAPLLELAERPAETMPDAEEELPSQQAELPPASEALADKLQYPRTWLQDLIDLLRDRRQVILYGPPGTGKTFLATRLAQHLTGDPQNVKLVQFHPAYSYEDFFEGYRPRPGQNGAITFELRPGPFRRLVDRARSDPGRPYILIIDELNRANLASVFGELYFLLEYRNEAIDLLYSGDEQSFTLPENVFLIGTMNTVDRSIALVDAAMRRRFGFVGLHPAEEPVRDLLARWLQLRGFEPTAAGLLTVLNDRIRDHDLAVGPSYFMRDEVHADGEGLRRVWATSVLPLLQEYHHGTLSAAAVAERYRFEVLLAEVEGGPA
jgi:5-methylcytosine-specific restriction protein B